MECGSYQNDPYDNSDNPMLMISPEFHCLLLQSEDHHKCHCRSFKTIMNSNEYSKLRSVADLSMLIPKKCIIIFLISLDDLRKDTSIKIRPRSINDSL